MIECGWTQSPHSYSDENDIANAKMKIHKFAGILKLIKENDLIVDEQSYHDVYKALQSGFNGNFVGGASPSTLIPYNDSLWKQFFTEIETAMGKQLPEELKEKLIQLRNTGREKDKEAEKMSGHKHTICGSENFSIILGDISRCCLEPYREKYLNPNMEEYISQYQNLMQEFSQLSQEEREEALQKLASSLNEEFFSSDKTSQTFFDKLQKQGLLTEEDKIAISVILEQGDIREIESEDMRKFIESHRGDITESALVSRILSKKIEDVALYSKKITELSEEEKQSLKYKIQDLATVSQDGYSIKIHCQKVQDDLKVVDAIGEVPPMIYIETDEAETLLSKRLEGIEYFSTNANGDYQTNFTTIQDTESVGEYLLRMQECIELINRQISGEDIRFSPNGTQQKDRDISQAIQMLSTKECLGISEINLVTSEMRKDLTQIQQQQIDTNRD